MAALEGPALSRGWGGVPVLPVVGAHPWTRGSKSLAWAPDGREIATFRLGVMGGEPRDVALGVGGGGHENWLGEAREVSEVPN